MLQPSTEELLSRINQPLPFSLEAEKGMLSCLLQTTPERRMQWIQRLDITKHFYREDHRIMFRVIREMALEGVEPELVLLTNHMRERDLLDKVGVANVTDFYIYAPVDSHAEYYLSILDVEAKKRQIVGLAIRAAHQAITPGSMRRDRNTGEEQPATPDDILADLSTSIMEMGQDRRNRGVSVRMAVSNLIDRMESPDCNGLRSSFPWINRMTGGYERQTLTIIGGQRGSGKSAIALQEAITFARSGAPGDYFNLEMTAEAQVKRGMQQDGVSSNSLRLGTLNQEEHGILARWAREKLPMMIYDRLFGIEDIVMQLRIDKLQRRIQWAIIDLVQRVHGRNRRYDSREAELADIGHLLKDTAKELDLPIIILSHLNESLQAKYCANLENDADVMWIIGASDRPAESGPNRIIKIMKNRDGESGSRCGYYFDGPHTKFTELEPTQLDIKPIKRDK